jgi:hypothetical protein
MVVDGLKSSIMFSGHNDSAQQTRRVLFSTLLAVRPNSNNLKSKSTGK